MSLGFFRLGPRTHISGQIRSLPFFVCPKTIDPRRPLEKAFFRPFHAPLISFT